MFQKVLGNHGGVWARERPQQAGCIGRCDWDMPGGSARPGHLVSVFEATSFFEARPPIRPRSEGGEWGISFRPWAREPLCLSVPAPRPDSAAPGSMVLSKEPARGASGWCCAGRGAGSLSPRVARFPSSVSCLASSCPSSPGLPWHWAPLGGAQGCGFTGASQLLHSLPTNRSSCLGTPAASLGCSQDSQSPLVLLLGPCKGELHALFSVLTRHLRSPPSSSPTPDGPPAIQLHPDSLSLEVVSVTQVEGSLPLSCAPHLRRQAQHQFGSPGLPINLL